MDEIVDRQCVMVSMNGIHLNRHCTIISPGMSVGSWMPTSERLSLAEELNEARFETGKKKYQAGQAGPNGGTNARDRRR